MWKLLSFRRIQPVRLWQDDYCKIDVTNILLLMRVCKHMSSCLFMDEIGENYVLLDFQYKIDS